MPHRTDRPDRLFEKIDPFILSELACTLTGTRRMGVDALMDAVAERLKEMQRNVIRAENGDMEHIRNNIINGSKNCVLFNAVVDDMVLNDIFTEFPDVDVYIGQELCHQVPACVKVRGNPDGTD